jgi:hypothetical protein
MKGETAQPNNILGLSDVERLASEALSRVTKRSAFHVSDMQNNCRKTPTNE